MLKLDIIVNNIEKIQLSFNHQVRVEQIINSIIQTFQFPKQSTYSIEIDQVIKDPQDILNVQPKTPIRVNCQFETTITFFDQFNTSLEYRLDLCKSILQIQQEIMREILPIEYNVQIIQSNNNVNKLYINSYEEIPKQLEFYIQASFYINYEGHHQFKIHPFQIIQIIKHEIQEFFLIKQEFQLFYNETELNDHLQYISYLIPDHTELKIILQKRIQFSVKYQDTLHQYSCSLDQKLGVIRQKFRKIYQIPDKDQLQLTYKNTLLKNDQDCLQDMMIENNSIIILDIENRYLLTLQDKYSSQSFQCQVRSIDLISILDKQSHFINKLVTYYCNNQQLRKTLTFEQLQVDKQNLIIYYQIEKQIIKVYFQDENKKQQQIEVIVSDPIKNALQQLNQTNDPITISYGERNISIESTYEKEAIVNDGIIVYKINDGFQIKYTISPNSKENIISISRNTNGTQLLKLLSEVHQNQGYQYKLMLNNQEFPSDQLITPNQCFKLVHIFEISFYYQNDDQVYLDTFSLEHKIIDAKQKFSHKFNLPLDQMILQYKDVLLKDDQLIHQYKDKQLSIYQNKCINFQKRSSTMTISKQYNQNLQLKNIISDFLKEYNMNSCRFEFNKQLVDENKLLKEICQDQQQIVLIYEQEQNLTLENKLSHGSEKIKFYPTDIIRSIFSKYLNDNHQYLYKGKLIDIQKSFEDYKIKNNSCIEYYIIYNFTLEILNDKSNIQFQINSLDTKIEDAISSKIKEKYSEKFIASYNNRQIDLQKSFIQERINSNAIIQIQLITNLTVIIYENDLQTKYFVDPNINIEQLIKQIGDKKNKKLFNLSDQRQLEDSILLSTLKNIDNEVELIYKEVIPISITIYQPSEQISNCIHQTLNQKTTENSALEIIILNMINDEKLFQTVKLDQKIGDFLIDFQIKMEFSGINLFYEGELVDYNKTFEEIGAKSQSLFEII